MADIVINPSVGKIDFFSVKGDNVTNTLKLTGNTLLVTGPLSASSISTGGGGAFVTSNQPTNNYLSKFTGNSTIANSLIFDNGTNVGIGTNRPSASLQVNSSVAGRTLLSANGTNGSLFSVVDDLTDSLMSVNNSAGLPVLEVFADDRVVAGQYSANDFVIVNNKVGIGTNNPVGKLHVTGSSTTPAATFIGNVGIGTTSFVYSNANRGDIEIYGSTDALISLRNATANSYIHKTGNDFYINNGGAGNLVLQNNGSERVRIDSSGNVGIGTSSPAYLTDIQSTSSPLTLNLKLNKTSTTNDYAEIAFQLWSGAGSGANTFGGSGTSRPSVVLRALNENGSSAAGAFIVGTFTGGADNSTLNERFRITSVGNVGIGTSSPANKLYVNGDGYFASTLLIADNTALNFGNTSQIYHNSSRSSTQFTGTGGSDTMCIKDNGNVGIGSTNPAGKLDVIYTGGTANFGNTAGGNNFIWTRSSGGSISLFAGGAMGLLSTGNINFYTNQTYGSETFAASATITTSGNVGIGTTSPVAKLDVNGTSNFAANVYHSVGGQKFFAGSGGAYNYIYTGTTSLNFINGNDTSTLMTLLNNGSVGIGLTNPSYKLQVNGDIYASGPTYSPYLSAVAGTYNDLNAPDIAFNSMYKGDAHNYDIFQFNAPNTYETQATSGGAWTSAAVNQDIFLGDTTGPSTLTIPNGTFAVRFTWNSIGYRFFNCLYIMNSTQGNYYTVTIEHSANGTTWTTVGTTGGFSGWPGHSRYINYWNNSTTQTYLRLTLTPTWQNANNIFIYIMRYFCSYYLNGAIRLYTWDYSRKVTFPTYLTVAGTDNNSNKADFSVDTGGTATMALSGQYFRVGSTDVNWNMKIQSNGYIATYAQQLDIATTAGAYAMTFATNGTERMRIDGSSGNVGVGFTTVPVHKLQASGLVSASDPTYNNDSTFIGAILNNDGTNPGLDLRRWNGGGAGTNNHGATYIATNSVGDTIFYNGLIAANTRATSEKMRIVVNGNVGIGTSSPSYKVHIVQSTPTSVTTAPANTSIQVDSNSHNYLSFVNTADNQTYAGITFTDNNLGGYIVFRNYTGDVLNGSDCLIYGTYQDHIFQTGTTGTVNSRNEVMRIKNNGNVGIGSTSPAYKLDVVGGVRATIDNDFGFVLKRSATNVWCGIGYYTANTSKWFYGMREVSDDNLRWYNYTNSAERMVLTEAGSLGIGTTSPNYKLDVNGTFNASGTSTLAAVSVTGTITTSATEAMRINNNNGYISFYNSAGSTRYGYLQGLASGAVVLAAESGATLQFIVNGSERTRIDTSGNVGIGTSNPTSKLHIVTTGTNDGIILDGTSNPIFVHRTSGSDRTYLATTTNAGAFFTDAGQYDFIIRSQANNILLGRGSGTSTMAIVGSNVGIGTTTPSAKLHLYSSTSGATLVRTDGTNGVLFSVVDDLTDSLMSVNNSAGLPVFEVFADDRVIAGQYSANDFVVVNNKVGIGTNIPVAKLHVTGSTSLPAAAFLGDVGIGTTSPTSQANYRFLQVNGPVSAVIETNVAGSRIGGFDSTSNTLYVGTIGSYPVVFRTAVNEKMRIAADGNIGIGTSSPTHLLTLSRATQTTAYQLNFNTDGGISDGNYTGIRFSQGAGGGTELGNIKLLYFTTGATALSLGVRNASQALYIGTDGNVGIGTTAVNAKLQVVDGGADWATSGTIGTTLGSIHLSPSNNTANYGNAITFGARDSSPYANANAGIYVRSGGGFGTTMAFATTDSYAVGSKVSMFIDSAGAVTIGRSNLFVSAGSVGIGTTSANSKLHVVGTTSVFQTAGNTYLAFDHSGITTWRFGAFADNSSTLYMGCDVSGGNFNNKILALTNGGNVGIGTTNPIAKLHVSGSTMMMGDGGSFKPRQTIVGTKTAAASTTYIKIFSCGHTSTGIINVIAIITSAATASATATFSFANAYGLGATPYRMSYVSVNSTITSIDCIYNNTGYMMTIAVTYSGGTAPTLYFTAEGMGSENWAL